MVDMVKYVHNNYEKITDDIMWLNYNWVFKFYVTLNRYSDKYGRTNFHKEVSYYKNNNFCININRSFDYGFMIESSKAVNGFKESVYIRPVDHYAFIYKLNQVAEWFVSSEYSDLFANKDGNIIVMRRVDPIIFSDLSFGKKIEFVPDVSENEFGDKVVGVSIYIDTNPDKLFLPIYKFLGFKHIVDNFNMFMAAQNMITYLSRPEGGTNLFDINQMRSEFVEDTSYVSPQKIKPQNNSSLTFFSKTGGVVKQ